MLTGALAAGAFAVAGWCWAGGTYACALSVALLGGAALVGLVAAPSGAPATNPPDASAPDAEFGDLLDHVPAPLLLVDRRETLHAVNRAARLLFETEDRVIGVPPALRSAFADPARKARVVIGESAAAAAFDVSIVEIPSDGRTLRLAMLASAPRIGHTEETAALQNAMEIVTHEILNSLTPILSLAESASQALDGLDRQGELGLADMLLTIRRRAEGLEHFIQGYRRLTRLAPPRKREVELLPWLAEIATLFRSHPVFGALTLELRAPLAGESGYFDPDLVAQALLNLLYNAAHATLAAARAAPLVRLSLTGLGSRSVFLVEDNGGGIDPQARAHLFEPFISTRDGGSGLGLFVARQVALSHGGDVRLVRSSADQGCMFELRL